MDKFKRISDSLQDLSGGQIILKKRKVAMPVLYIIIGIFLMWWGIAKWTEIGYELTSYILVIGGLFIVGWGTVMLTFNTHFYEVKESGQKMKPTQIYLDPNSQDVVEELMKKGDLNSIIKKGINTKSPLMLELWQADTHKLLYAQLIYKRASQTQPVSEPLIMDKNQMSS